MLGKYYSLDECTNVEVVTKKLEQLQEDGKIYFSNTEQDQDIIKIRDTGLSPKELKDLVLFFEKNDVIEYDYEDAYEDDDFDEFDEFDEFDDDYEEDF